MQQKHNRPPIKRTQQGLTLIGLMISIVITLLSVLTSLHLYFYNERTVDSIRAATAHNRALMSAMVVIQKKIQAAGFGIAGADEEDVVTLFTPSSSSAPASRAILWRYIDNGIVECQGVREVGITINNQSYRQLRNITSVSDCNTSAPLGSLAWDGATDILGHWEIDNLLSAHLATNETLFNFHLSKADCSISRLTTSGEHSIATISVPNTAGLNGHAIPSNVINICLVNVQPN